MHKPLNPEPHIQTQSSHSDQHSSEQVARRGSARGDLDAKLSFGQGSYILWLESVVGGGGVGVWGPGVNTRLGVEPSVEGQGTSEPGI